MKLYTYWRSSAAYRVRIALNLKGAAYESIPVDLLKGEQRSADYLAINPSGLVPTLVTDDGNIMTQSRAIIRWLDASYPDRPLIPTDADELARVEAATMVIAADIHPLNNSRVLARLSDQFGADMDARIGWMQHWMRLGFDALEEMLGQGRFAFGDQPGLADIFLVAQLYNAKRWGLDPANWSRLAAIDAACLAMPEFEAALPENQPDAD